MFLLVTCQQGDPVCCGPFVKDPAFPQVLILHGALVTVTLQLPCQEVGLSPYVRI